MTPNVLILLEQNSFLLVAILMFLFKISVPNLKLNRLAMTLKILNIVKLV